MLDSVGMLRWVKWGLLREHANGHMGTLINFSMASFQVWILSARFLTNSKLGDLVIRLGDGHFLYPGRQSVIANTMILASTVTYGVRDELASGHGHCLNEIMPFSG
jgi:hypothetical protein